MNESYELAEADELEELESQPVITAKSRLGDAQIIVRGVVRVYNEMSEIPMISAIRIDPQAPPSHPWKPVVAEFIADVESTLRRYLMHQPNRIALRQAWNGILLEDGNPSRITTDQQRLILALGPIFQRAGLLPKKYFSARKRSHHSERYK